MNYILIQSWMISRLQLKGINLLIFAIIHGFSQDGKSVFKGSINYLCRLTGYSHAQVIRSLQILIKNELILKIQDSTHQENHYSINYNNKNISAREKEDANCGFDVL